MYSYVGWAPGSREEAVASLQASYAALQHAVMTAAGWRADPYGPPACLAAGCREALGQRAGCG